MEGESSPPPPPQKLIVAMNGHPGTGKSTLARTLALAIGCPLLDKDDIRDYRAALEQQPSVVPSLNDLSYAILWRMARTHLDLGLSVFVDFPLSRLVDSPLSRLVDSPLSRLVDVERRGCETAGGDPGWHKPGTWDELGRLVEHGCEMDGCSLDCGCTTSGADYEGTVRMVLEFIRTER